MTSGRRSGLKFPDIFDILLAGGSPETSFSPVVNPRWRTEKHRDRLFPLTRNHSIRSHGTMEAILSP